MKNREKIYPNYKREKCKIGFAHIGVGNFHRAHQAYYIDQYMNDTNDLNWGIVGINLRQNEKENLKNLKKRDGKYILKTISTDGQKKFNEIHSIIKLLDWNDNAEESESILTNPDIEILTMTVTESGYYIDSSNQLNTQNEIVKKNIEGKESNIIFSYLQKALNFRKKTCNKPITLICCDNIRNNGEMLKNTLNSYLKNCKDEELIEWIKVNVSFPSCVVDRITPRPPNNLSKEIEQTLNINEKCSVMAEPYIQWIVEDSFITKRPKLEKVGLKFVKNVNAYEEAKIRILNGSHVALSYFGALKGYKTYDQAINDKELQKYFFNLQKNEIIPGLNNEIPFNLLDYMMIIFDRFKNVNITDKLERIAMDGVGKFPIFIVPTIKSCLEKKIIPIHSIESIASWYIFMRKINLNKINFSYYEPSWEWIKIFLDENNLQEFIKCKELWNDLPTYPVFQEVLNEKIHHFAKVYN